MATKKKMLQAAAGNATGGAGLNVEDVFSTYLYEGNGGSQAIENGINLGQSFGSGSARFGGASTGEYLQTPVSTDFQLGNNDFTLEFFMRVTNDAGENKEVFSVGDSTGAYDFLVFLSVGNAQVYMSSNGTSWDLINGGNCGNYTIGKWHHIAVTRNVDGVRCYLDGVQGSGHGIGSANVHQSANQISIGRGQTDKRFNGYLSDFHFVNGTAKYISDFTVPTSALSVDANTKLLTLQQDSLLTDNSTTGHTITEYGGSIYDEPVIGPFDADEAGEGGLVWVKWRSGNASVGNNTNHILVDSERGTSGFLESDTTNAETSTAAVSSFNSDGFTTGGAITDVDNSGDDYASWTFRKAPKFFTCLTYSGTGPGSGANEQQVSHDLGAKPGIVIIKRTDATGDWWVFTDVIDGSNDYGYLNQTVAFGNSANNVATDTVFNVGGSLNTSGATYVAYLFASNDGDGGFGPDGDADIIKCGSYTAASNGVEINLGFEPQWVMFKRADSTGGWKIIDTMRGFTVSDNPASLEPNTSDAEGGVAKYRITNTGFRWNSDQYDTGDYIYIAIRRGTKVPESATEVFNIDVRDDTDAPMYKSGFVTDFSLYRDKAGNDDWRVTSRLQGTGGTFPEISTAAESSAYTTSSWDWMNGFHDAGSVNTGYLSWMWKRAPGYFDAVAYTGNGTAGRTVSHNLGVAPELLIVKRRDLSGGWKTYVESLGPTKALTLNETVAAENQGSSLWNSTSPTADVFTVGTNFQSNASGGDYIAYLFASLDGVSKVGSYTGNGTSQTIDCGFTSGARFVLIKRTDSSGDWNFYDTERGIVAGNDSRLSLNTTDAEDTSNDRVDPYSSGFTVNYIATGTSDSNISGATYIFYAVA